jgi:hypothetical protein
VQGLQKTTHQEATMEPTTLLLFSAVVLGLLGIR